MDVINTLVILSLFIAVCILFFRIYIAYKTAIREEEEYEKKRKTTPVVDKTVKSSTEEDSEDLDVLDESMEIMEWEWSMEMKELNGEQKEDEEIKFGGGKTDGGGAGGSWADNSDTPDSDSSFDSGSSDSDW